MKSVLKVLLLCLIAFTAITAVVYAALSQTPPHEALLPIVSILATVTVGWCVVRCASAVFTKRHTAATGFG